MEDKMIDTFEKERTCKYRGEVYQVRDNGAILRQSRKGESRRPNDEKWTFGTINKQKGYLCFGAEAVHRIVATAFLGEPPTEKHIVDHIDTNKQNNRPENLRWVTRLENILINPITLSRIIHLFGSIDNFLSNPKKPLNGILDQKFDWMRTVTKEESENTKNNLLKWAEEGKIPKGGTLGEWVFSNLNQKKHQKQERNSIIQSLTINALQKKWNTPSEFPECPTTVNTNSLINYKNSLSENAVFSKNRHGSLKVISADYYEPDEKLFVLTYNADPNPVKRFALSSVYIENEKYIHENLGSFFERNGAEKQFFLVRGLEWNGGDLIDNYL